MYVLKGKLRIPTFSQPSITYWNATIKNKAQKISREKTCSPRLRLHRAVEGKETNRYLQPYFKCWSKGNESRCFRREERGITDGWRWELKNCIGETSDLLERQVEFCLMLASTLLRVTGWGNTICKNLDAGKNAVFRKHWVAQCGWSTGLMEEWGEEEMSFSDKMRYLYKSLEHKSRDHPAWCLEIILLESRNHPKAFQEKHNTIMFLFWKDNSGDIG